MSPPAGRTILVHLADQRRSRTDSHGIIDFSLGLVRGLPGALGDDDRLVVAVTDELAAELGSAWARPQDTVEVVPTPTSAWARLVADHRTIVDLARTHGVDAVVHPKGFLPLAARRRRWRQVASFHDDIPRRLLRDRTLRWRRRVKAAYFASLLGWSLRRADRRLFVTAASARALLGGPVREGQLGERDAVIGEGIPFSRRPARPIDGRERQAVVFGSALPHKRTAAGVRLLHGDDACRAAVDTVVLVGHHPDDLAPGPLAVDHRPGPLTTEEVVTLIGSSRLLVFPSEHEGFGLPPVEAYALGTPAVYRRTAASDEVLAGAPGGFDEETASSFGAAAREALALDDATLARWSDRMWARHDWGDVARRVVAAIGQA